MRWIWIVTPLILFGVIGIQESFAQEYDVYKLTNAPKHSSNLTFDINYNITNADLQNIHINFPVIVIEIISNDDGILEIEIPKNIHYVQRNEEPEKNFFILIDGNEVEFDKQNLSCFIKYTIPFSNGSKIIEILTSSLMDSAPINPYKISDNCIIEKSKEQSPKKQIASGIFPEDVICRTGLELVFKSTDNSPACVKQSTVEKLIQRGWAQK